LAIRACSANGGASSGSSLVLMVMPSASHSLPGPEHSAALVVQAAVAAPSGNAVGRLQGADQTALAEPPFSQTKFTHQWMP